MTVQTDLLKNVDLDANTFRKEQVVKSIVDHLAGRGYDVAEINQAKPWGAYIRLSNSHADAFIAEFFPGLSPKDARFGRDDAELSPKILIVAPGQRLSWQYHHRRAERWVFLTEGSYNKSLSDEPGDAFIAQPGDVVQFERSERHRLNGLSNSVVIAAEIWQHVDPSQLSDEDDIVRISDDYSR